VPGAIALPVTATLSLPTRRGPLTGSLKTPVNTVLPRHDTSLGRPRLTDRRVAMLEFYAASRIRSHAVRASAVVGSKSALVRRSTSPRSAQSCSLDGRPQNQ
jgi:hypothetical protein